MKIYLHKSFKKWRFQKIFLHIFGSDVLCWIDDDIKYRSMTIKKLLILLPRIRLPVHACNLYNSQILFDKLLRNCLTYCLTRASQRTDVFVKYPQTSWFDSCKPIKITSRQPTLGLSDCTFSTNLTVLLICSVLQDFQAWIQTMRTTTTHGSLKYGILNKFISFPIVHSL
jgi:hypothetical protein